MLPEPETGVTSRVWGDNRRVWDTVNRPQTLPRRNGDLCEAPCGAPLDLVNYLSLGSAPLLKEIPKESAEI